MLMRYIAIIGSGPAGCYLADQLLRLAPDARIDVIERLPVPFGLVRYGVAPDHQGSKAVVRVLDRVLAREQVGFYGNVEVGRDLTLEELRALYDTVVLATGAPQDRRLGVPGEDLPGVIGAASFVGWYNNHPDHAEPPLHAVRSAVVIGNGNVAVDVARLLAKSHAELAGSDLAPDVQEKLAALPLEVIHIVGRRGAADAKFTQKELAELGTLSRASTRVADVSDPAAIVGDSPIVDILRGYAADTRELPIRIVFHFGLAPRAFVGDGRLQAVRFTRADGSEHEIPAELAVSCIGYRSVPCCSAEPADGVFASDNGRIDDGLYVTGWARRGPSGTIPTNRTEAQQLAQRVAAETVAHGRAGGQGLAALLAERGRRRIDHAAWRAIDAAELAQAAAERCRRKFETVEAMLEAAGRSA